MKKLITIVAGVLLVGFSALAQGTILLQNFGTGFTTSQVRDVNNVLIAKDAPITVELLAGTAANSLTPFTTAITTTHWAGAGYFGLGEPTPGSQRVLPGFLPGTFPFFSDSSLEQYWRNNYLGCRTGGGYGICARSCLPTRCRWRHKWFG